MARAGLVCVLAGLLLTACTSGVTLTAQHNPLFLEQAHTSQITANATSTQGLELINIEVTAGTMVSCEFDGDLPSSIPCRTNATTQTTTCAFAVGQTQGACTASVDLGRHSIVTYRVQGKSRNGRYANLPAITYAGGEPLIEAFCWWDWTLIFPDMDCATAFSPLSPMWWETADPAGGSQRGDRIDLGFYQDVDYGADAQTFSNEMNPTVMNVFFNPMQTFAQDYTRTRRYFTLWKGPPGGDRDSCGGSFGFSSNTGASAAAAMTDAEVLIHSEGANNDSAARGCAQLRLGGGAWVWVDHAMPANNVTHESGHMLYGLGDEYCCDGGYSSISTPRNLFTSASACETAATSIGAATTLCVKVANAAGDTVERWHIYDGQLNVMRSSRNVNTDWRFTGDRARSRLIDRCTYGDCF